MLNKGAWDGERLLDPDVVLQATKHTGHPFSFGLAWLTNSDMAGNKLWPSLPWDAFAARGAGMQILLIIPSLNLIMMRNGADVDAGPNYEALYEHYMFWPLMEAVTNVLPFSWSEKINRVD